MSKINEIPVTNFATTRRVIEMALKANQAVLMFGDPGVGKSALAYEVARDLKMGLAILLGSTLDPTDVGGLPVVRVDGKGVDRVPLQLIRQAAETPCVLFLDEISAAPLAVQAAMLRLVLERTAGDVVLHPDTRILAACNPPEQAPGGFDLSAPLMGRVCAVRFRPDAEEILTFLGGLGSGDDSDEGRALADEAMSFAGVARAAPELLQIDIPPSCVSGAIPWGAPRAWERVIRARAAAVVLGITDKASIHAVTAGSVGRSCAMSYQGVLDMVDDLPTAAEIAKDPHKAKLPADNRKQIGALALMPRIARINLWAAYIYAARMAPEYAMAAHKGLMPLHALADMKTPFAVEGLAVRRRLTDSIKFNR